MQRHLAFAEAGPFPTGRRRRARRRALAAFTALALLVQLVLPLAGAAAGATPVAAAGSDRAVASGLLVTLDGSGSSDPGGGTLTYEWTQTGGPSVALEPVNGEGSKAEFFAPLVAASTDLTFRLTVSNGTFADTGDVKVTVVPGALPERLSSQPGRSGWQDIKSVGRNVYVAWCYRNGGALNIWFTKSTDGGATYERPQLLTPVGDGDCEGPKIAVEGDNVYVAWRRWISLPGPGSTLGGRIAVARSSGGGVRGTWETEQLGEGASAISLPEIAASTDGVDHDCFVLYQAAKAGGNPLVLATSRDRGATFSETTVEANASDQSGMRSLAAEGDHAYVAYVGSSSGSTPVKVYGRRASSGDEQRGSFSETGAFNVRLASSGEGRLAVVWGTMSAGLTRAYGSVLSTSTLSGTKSSINMGGSADQCAPEVAWTGDAFVAAWVEMAHGPAGGTDYVCTARVRTGGGLTDAQKVHALEPRPHGGGYYGGLVSIAGSAGLVGLGWWDQIAGRAFTAVSRDGGHAFESVTDCGTWVGESGAVGLASNAATEAPAVHASFQGNLRMDPVTNDVSCDLYVKRLASIADNDLALEKLQVVQAPWDDSPTQRLARDKKTAFRLDVTNGYATAVTTRVELRYTQVTGGVPNQTVMAKDVTLPPYDTKHVYFDGILLTGDSVAASATVNPADSPLEANRDDNEASLTSRKIIETQKLDCLYVPVVLPGDRGPDDAQFYSAISGWGRFIAETYPIDDQHWLSESRPAFNWTPEITGYTPGSRLTSKQYNEIEAQLAELAKATGHEAALGFVRPKWFAERGPSEYSHAVGLAPFNDEKHVGMEEVGQPAQIGAHEIAHTYGLIPPGTPGDMPAPNDGHFDRLVVTGYSASRGEIASTDSKNPTFDMMQWTAVPNAWIGTTSFYLLMDRLKTGAGDPEVVLLSGDVDRAAMTGELGPAYRFNGDADIELGTTGDLRFVFKDGSDTVLASAGYDPSFAHAGAGLAGMTGGDFAAFSVKVPWVTGAEKIELVYKGTLLDTVLVSPNAPTVTIAAPAAGTRFSVGETVTVSWSGSDADGGTLSYLPMLSVDDGATWAPLRGATTATSCEFVPTRQTVTGKARVKVVASDGVNSGEDVSGTFAMDPVVPVGASGGGVPAWGAIHPFPKPSNSPDDINPGTWSLGANGSTLYAGWLQLNTLWDSNQHLRLKRSFDGGATWEPVRDVLGGGVQVDSSSQDYNDAKFFDFRGDTIYTLHCERIDGSNSRLVLHKSTNGGGSFDTSTTVTSWTTSVYPKLYRPHWLVDGERVYVVMERYTSTTHGLVLLKSTDGGATFGSPVDIVEGPWNGVGSVGSDPHFRVEGDDVYVAFQRGNTNTFGPPDGALAVSRDGGATFSAAQVILTNCYNPNVAAEGGRVCFVAGASTASAGLKVRASADYGVTFGGEQSISGGWRGDFGISPPAILMNGDKVTLVWQGRVDGSPITYPYFSAASTDGGASFGPAFNLLSVAPTPPAQTLQHSWGLTDDSIRVQGDSVYVATHLLQHWVDPGGGGQADVPRLAVYTSTDFGATFGAPALFAPELQQEDASAKAVLAVTPGFVYAGTDLDTYFTDYDAFVVCGSTGSAPAISAGEDTSVSEGQVASLTADFSADSAIGATATVDWGDGTHSVGACGGSGTTGTVEAAHAYGKCGTYDAKVTLSVGGQSAEDTFSVTVANVAPEVSAPTTTTATTAGLPWQPGEVAFSDAGWDDPVSATIDWGDGSAAAPAHVNVTTPGGGGWAQAGSIDATHAYSADGTYEAVVTVSDGSAETTAGFLVLVQANGDPSADAGGPYVADEGSTVSLDASASSDPDGNALMCAWSLGGEALGSPFGDNGRLALCEPDDFAGRVRLTVRDGRGGAGTAEADVTFVNVPPAVTATASRTVTLDHSLSLPATDLAAFADPGLLDTHTARIDWGDGSSSDGVVTESAGTGRVSGGHSYEATGAYTVTVTVTDDDGGTAGASLVLAVETTNAPPAADDVSVTTTAGVSVPIHLSATDADGDPLTWLPASPPTAGTLLGSAPDLTYAPNAGFTGTDEFAFAVTDGQGGSDVASVTVTVLPASASVQRTEGDDRYGTALAASEEAFPDGAPAVVIASGQNWPDAAGGAALAAAKGAPILLTRKDQLPPGLLAEVRRLGAKEAIVLGSEAAVGREVFDALVSELGTGKVARTGGRDRYETAQLIAKATVALLGPGYDGTCFMATGGNFPDALAASPLAGAKGWPMLLASPAGPSASTLKAMDAIGVKKVLVLGDTAAVPAGVESALEGRAALRLGGPNRYETAKRVAAYGVSEAGLSWDKVAIATGEDFPDALAGGVLQARERSVILLTPGAFLHAAPKGALTANKAAIRSVRFLGGEAAIGAKTRAEVAEALL